MTLITNTQLLTMDYDFRGAVYIQFPVKPSIDLYTMDYDFRGAVFIRNGVGSTPPVTNLLKTINYALLTDLQDAMGVPIVNLKEYNQASNI